MRTLLTVLLVAGMAWGQEAGTQKPAGTQPQTTAQGNASETPQNAAPAQAAQQPATAPDPNAAVIPAGTKIPLLLKQAISTKNAREGDPVYAETAFPFVVNDRILVPAGTYIQGRIQHAERAGRVKGRAEILIHFTSMIYPNGYTLMLPASVENTPGSDNKGVKDSEGTIQQDKDTGKKIEDAAKGGVWGTMGGATAGGLATGGLNGARVGAGVGAAAGVAWALLRHGPDVKLDVGTSIEMEIQRDIPVDMSRVQVARAQ
jgi:type IV secretion system protein VirB10